MRVTNCDDDAAAAAAAAAATGVSEKQKWDANEKKMTETICHRDGRIVELERRCSQHSHETTQLAARFDDDGRWSFYN